MSILSGTEPIYVPLVPPEFNFDASEFGYESDLAFSEILAKKVGVGAVPGSSFFKEHENRYIRLHFAKKDDTLNEALNRLSSMRKNYLVTSDTVCDIIFRIQK